MKGKKQLILIISSIIILLVGICFIAKNFFNTLPTQNITVTDVESAHVELLPDKETINLDKKQIENLVSSINKIEAKHEYFEYNKSEKRYKIVIKKTNGSSLNITHVLDNRFMINDEVYVADERSLDNLINFENQLK